MSPPPKLTKEQAAIVGAYTGYAIGSFSDMHKYIEEKLGRPVFTHELANKDTWDSIREATKSDYIALSP